MPTLGRAPGEEAIGQRFISIGERLQNPGKVTIWDVRGDEDAGVLRQLHVTSSLLHDLGGPAPAPRHPRLVQRPKVVDVMGDERPTVLGCTQENLNVGQSAAAELFGRIDVPALRAEKTSKPMRDIFVENDPQVRHVLRLKSGCICLEQSVNGATMLVVIEHSCSDSFLRNIVGHGGLGDHVIGDGVRLGRSRDGVDVSNKRPHGNALGQKPAPRRPRPVRVEANHASQMFVIGDGGRRAFGRVHEMVPTFRHRIEAGMPSIQLKAYRSSSTVAAFAVGLPAIDVHSEDP